jgi:hypothetical protein
VRGIVSLLLIAVLVGSSTAALCAPPQDCKKIRDDSERLACYDARDGAAAHAAGESKARNPSPAAASNSPGFGLSPPQPDEHLESTLADVQRDRLGRAVLSLGNGQVWRQVNYEHLPSPRSGSQVVVTRSSYGGYWMRIEGVSEAVQVTRLRQSRRAASRAWYCAIHRHLDEDISPWSVCPSTWRPRHATISSQSGVAG